MPVVLEIMPYYFFFGYHEHSFWLINYVDDVLSPFFSSSLNDLTVSFSPNRLGDIQDLDKKIFDIYAYIFNEIEFVSPFLIDPLFIEFTLQY